MSKHAWKRKFSNSSQASPTSRTSRPPCSIYPRSISNGRILKSLSKLSRNRWIGLCRTERGWRRTCWSSERAKRHRKGQTRKQWMSLKGHRLRLCRSLSIESTSWSAKRSTWGRLSQIFTGVRNRSQSWFSKMSALTWPYRISTSLPRTQAYFLICYQHIIMLLKVELTLTKAAQIYSIIALRLEVKTLINF